MRERRKAKAGNKMTRALCGILLCSMTLTGCGRVVTDRRQGEPESGENYAQGQMDGQQDTGGQSGGGQTAGRGNETTQEILARLVEDEGVCGIVWDAAGIEEGDTEAVILGKLEACDTLTLREAAYGKEIHSLEALAWMPNLRDLTIDFQARDGSRIKDFTPISGLSRLEQLYIEYDTGEEIDLSFLADMDTVTVLLLPNCRIKDSSFLWEMPQLERLSLYETPVEDLSVLENMPELVELALSGNSEAKNIEAVGSLLKMRSLGLQNCGIEDISFLSNLSELRGVNLNSNELTDLSPLAGLTGLEQLGAADNHIEDISPLAGLTNLFNLSLDVNEIRDISALAGMDHLNQLGLTENQIEDLSPLEGKEELCYVAVYDNPCEDISAVREAPLLNLTNMGVLDGQRETVDKWMEANRPEVEDYECIDFVQGDLNGDKREDIAFVVNGDFQDGGDVYARDNTRRLFVLLQQSDGSFQELKDAVSVPDVGTGGMRGDPYRGMWMGKGCLILQREWGSSSGIAQTDIYLYRRGELTLSESITVIDFVYAEGYDVRVGNEEDGSWQRYVIAMEGERMVKVALVDSEHAAHKAFPDINLFRLSYRIRPDGYDTETTPAEALEAFADANGLNVEKEALPYAAWQKQGYERLLGVELPDYYYVVPGEEEHYIYYSGVTTENGALLHRIFHVEHGDETEYLLDDLTGEITELTS